MKKHALMLTAATVASLTGQAQAAGPTTITTKTTTALKTSTSGDITIGTGGSVVVTAGSPVIEIDSNNRVNNSVSGATISNIGTTGAIGLQLDATTAGNGPGGTAFTNLGVVDLSGSGTSKTGILVGLGSGSTTGIFNGGIDLGSGSTLKVAGDGSYGIHIAANTTLVGDIVNTGSLTINTSSATSTAASTVAGVLLDGTLNGNFLVDTGGSITSVGSGAEGVVLAGAVNGAGGFTNKGILQTIGTSTPKLSGGNPEAGSALIIANNIVGGIYNAGPITTAGSTTRASISASGTSPAILIAPGSGGAAATPIHIGFYASELGGAYGFINRGTIIAKPIDPNLSSLGISMQGDSTNTISVDGGIFNGGSISAAATTDGKAATAPGATAMIVGDYVTVPKLVNDAVESGGGTISASVSGAGSGTAAALVIGTNGNLAQLINTGSITAAATSTDRTVTSLVAYAIRDASGTLLNIDNSGTISATATILDNNTQAHVAADLSAAKGAVTFMNSGTVTGDIKLGSFADTVTLTGTSSKSATLTGDIAFGGGQDTLTIGDFSSVTGTLTETGSGTVGLTVGGPLGTSTLTLTNASTGLSVSNLLVNPGATLNMAVAQAFNTTSTGYVGPIVSSASGTIGLAATSKFGLTYGSFISTPGGTGTAQFVLLDTQAGKLTIDNYATIKTSIAANRPYLFNVDLCAYNVLGADACVLPSGQTMPADSQLVLQLTPKNAQTIGLTGNAALIFDAANQALATDNPLGSAIVTYVRDQPTAQAAYASFLPDLSGSSRAVVVSLTDQATGPVGARQRALRMYAAQPGGATLWGQEFAQRLTSGGNADAYRGSGFGFALGMDDGDPRSGRYGAAFTFFSGDQTNKGPNFTKINNEWYMLSGYTDWRGKGLFFDSQLSVGYGSLNGKRYMQLTDTSNNVVFTRTAAGKRAGLLFAGGLSTGAIFTYGATVIAPQVSIDGLSMREEGYTESGGGNPTGGDGFDLKVQPYYANSARAYFGTTVREDIKLWDFYLQPEARIGYRYDFLSDPVKLKAAFASMANTANSQFTLTGPDPQRGNLVGGVSLAVTTGDWSLGLNYDYLRGNSGAVSQAGTITLIGRI